MEEDEDDLYGHQGAPRQNGQRSAVAGRAVSNTRIKDEDEDVMDEGDDGANRDGDMNDDDDDDDDSDSDIDIITERKPNSTKPEPTSQSSSRLEPPKAEHTRSASASSDKASTKPAPSTGDPSQPHQKYSAPQSSKPGTDYPAIHTSTLDIDGPVPSYELANGESKPLTDLDFDADIAENTKPWRLPGTDQTDYFNYGFDEFTWATYCLKQKTMRDAIVEQKAESAKFEMMFGGGPAAMPGMPAQSQPQPPTGPQAGQQIQGQGQGRGQAGQPQQQGAAGMPMMPGMAGMPDVTPEMMNQLMQQMMASGIDPSQMDFGMFMQQLQAMPQGGAAMSGGPAMGGPGLGGPPQGPQQQHGYGSQGQGYGGGGGQRRGQGRRW